MSVFPVDKIEKLFSENKTDEAREEMKKWLIEQTETEDGEGLFDNLHAYVQLQNKYAKEYLAEINDLKEILKEIKKGKKGLADLEKSEKIKNKIKDL